MFTCSLSQNYTHTGDLASVWPPRDMQGVNTYLEISYPGWLRNHCASLGITDKIQKRKYLSNISVHQMQAGEGHHLPLQLLPMRLGSAPFLPRPFLLGQIAGGRAQLLDPRRDAGLESRCPLTPSPSLVKLGEVMTLSSGLLLFAAVPWDTALHIHQLGRCGATLLDGASSADRRHPQDGRQQDGIQRWIFSSRLPTWQMWLKDFLSRAVLRVSLSSSDLGNLLQRSEFIRILFG